MRALTALPALLAPALLAAGMASAQQDLPASSACRTALQALQTAEDAIADADAAASAPATPDAKRQRSVAARLYPLRKRVADACLGGLTTSPPPSQHTWAAPVMPARPPVELPRVAPSPLPDVVVPPPRPGAPVTITHCNAATCVASDGSTLTRVGPVLQGPRGACHKEGVFVRCP